MTKCCPHCLKEVDPCDLIETYKIPKGCICNPKEWSDPENIPAICDAFEPMLYPDHDLCRHCEHEKECHA